MESREMSAKFVIYILFILLIHFVNLNSDIQITLHNYTTSRFDYKSLIKYTFPSVVEKYSSTGTAIKNQPIFSNYMYFIDTKKFEKYLLSHSQLRASDELLTIK